MISAFRTRHGDFSRKYGDRPGSLDTRTRGLIEAHADDNPKVRIQALMQFLIEQLGEEGCPEEAKVVNYFRNYRNRHQDSHG